MARKAPNVQQRNQIPRDWGNWGSVLAAPNGPNWPATALADRQAEGLEIGDVCMLTAQQRRAFCTYEGTFGGRNAVWQTGVVDINITIEAPVSGTTVTVVGAIFLFINEVIRDSSRAYMGPAAAGSAILQLREVATATVPANATWTRAAAGLADTFIAGEVLVPATGWYTIELLGSAPGVLSLAYGIRLVK